MALFIFIYSFIYISAQKSEQTNLEPVFRISPNDYFIENYLKNMSISDIAKFLPDRLVNQIWSSVQDEDIGMWNVSKWAGIDDEIIIHIPFSKLLKLNFKNLDVIAYLGNIECLSPKKLALLAAGYKDHNAFAIGPNYSHIDISTVKKYRNMFCGFTKSDFKKISPNFFRQLAESKFFQMLKCCSPETFEFLMNSVIKYNTIGPPTTWSPSTVKSLGYLLTGLNAKQIRSIRFKSCAAMEAYIIQAIPVDTLKRMRPGQLLALKKEALMAWRRRTLMTHHLYSKSRKNEEWRMVLVLQFFYYIVFMYKF